MDLQLRGKRALVTGSSRGIGLQIARALAQEGTDVAIAARDGGRLAAAAVELAGAGAGRVVTAQLETGDDASVRAAVAAVEDELGGIDILVNNAATPGGTGPAVPPSQVTDEQFLDAVNVKVLGYLRTVRAIAPGMIGRGWGRIINVSGLAARTPGNFVATRLSSGTAIGRAVTAEEVAAVVAFLASPRSVAITGDAIVVGGGSIGAIHY